MNKKTKSIVSILAVAGLAIVAWRVTGKVAPESHDEAAAKAPVMSNTVVKANGQSASQFVDPAVNKKPSEPWWRKGAYAHTRFVYASDIENAPLTEQAVAKVEELIYSTQKTVIDAVGRVAVIKPIDPAVCVADVKLAPEESAELRDRFRSSLTEIVGENWMESDGGKWAQSRWEFQLYDFGARRITFAFTSTDGPLNEAKRIQVSTVWEMDDGPLAMEGHIRMNGFLEVYRDLAERVLLASGQN